MSAHDVKLFGDPIAASRLESRYARVKARSLLFPSLGCLPCTSLVGPGEDERAGRAGAAAAGPNAASTPRRATQLSQAPL